MHAVLGPGSIERDIYVQRRCGQAAQVPCSHPLPCVPSAWLGLQPSCASQPCSMPGGQGVHAAVAGVARCARLAASALLPDTHHALKRRGASSGGGPQRALHLAVLRQPVGLMHRKLQPPDRQRVLSWRLWSAVAMASRVASSVDRAAHALWRGSGGSVSGVLSGTACGLTPAVCTG